MVIKFGLHGHIVRIRTSDLNEILAVSVVGQNDNAKQAEDMRSFSVPKEVYSNSFLPPKPKPPQKPKPAPPPPKFTFSRPGFGLTGPKEVKALKLKKEKAAKEKEKQRAAAEKEAQRQASAQNHSISIFAAVFGDEFSWILCDHTRTVVLTLLAKSTPWTDKDLVVGSQVFVFAFV